MENQEPVDPLTGALLEGVAGQWESARIEDREVVAPGGVPFPGGRPNRG